MRPFCLLALLGVATLPAAAAAQLPDRFTNLQVLPETISRDSLINIMRGFSLSLGVRCQYCHVGGDGISFEGVEFHKDDDPDKRKARFMMRMLDSLNQRVLTALPDRDDPPTRMECKTCHRSLAKPALLTQELALVLDTQGADSAVARYRQLRESAAIRGIYDFGEWEMNLLGERLAEGNRVQDAIAIYALNAEFYPRSISIAFTLAGLYERAGNPTAAIQQYRRVLELRPDHTGAKERLAALGATPPG